MKTILKTSFSAIAIILFLFTGCKKDEDEIVDTTVVSGSWSIGSSTFKVAYTAKSAISSSTGGTLVMFVDAPFNSATVNALSLSFKTLPTTSGTYQLVNQGSTPTASQFQLAVGGPGGNYAYILPAIVNVEVTITAGKLKVVIPPVVLKSLSGAPDGTLTASLQEM